MNPRALFFCVAATLSCGVPQSGDGNPDGFNPPIGGDPTASGSRLKLRPLEPAPLPLAVGLVAFLGAKP